METIVLVVVSMKEEYVLIVGCVSYAMKVSFPLRFRGEGGADQGYMLHLIFFGGVKTPCMWRDSTITSFMIFLRGFFFPLGSI